MAGKDFHRILPLGRTHEEVYQGELAKAVPYHYMYGKEYCTTSLAIYSMEEVVKLQVASEQVDQIYQKVVRFAQKNLPDQYLIDYLGIHPALIPAAREEIPFHGVARQDWIVTEAGMKLIEVNTDTATGMPECTYLSEAIVSQYTQLSNPSAIMKANIKRAFARLIDYYRQQGYTGTIAFSCYDWHEEDLCNTRLLMEQVKELGYDPIYVPLEKLTVIPGQGLFVQQEKIDIWYRLYPLEYLVHDEDDFGFKTGEEILKLVTAGKLAMINPVQSILTQSKGFMALIWNLYEMNSILPKLIGSNSPLFSREELDIIQTYLLPTYYEDPAYFLEKEIPYVEKAIFGREGKGTSIKKAAQSEEVAYTGLSPEEVEELRKYYETQPKIYQQYFPMEKVELLTEGKVFKGYLLTGVYVIGGQYSGILPRVGEKVTDDLAYFCPAATLVDDNKKEDL